MKPTKLILLFWVSLNFIGLNAQKTVYLESNEFGRGVLKSRSGECFVVAPAHVVGESLKNIAITGNNNVLSSGKLAQTFGSDLAIIRVTEGGSQECEQWDVPENYSTILDNSTEGYLEIRNNSGGAKLMQVFFSEKDAETITIEPERANQSFTKGMSGASLFTRYEGKKIYLGMLQEVDEDGSGYVFQADDMERVLGGFFDKNEIKRGEQTIQKEVIRTVSPELTIDEGGFQFALISAKKSGSTVVCKLGLTSINKDGKLLIYNPNTKMYTEKGVEIPVTLMKLGNQEDDYRVGLNYTFIKGVQTPLELTFKDVETSSSGISLLKLQIKVNGKNTEVKLKNISFNGLATKLDIPKVESLNSIIEGGFQFALLSAKKSGNTVVCKLGITSINKDGKLLIYNPNTKIYTKKGIEAPVALMKLGNQEDDYRVGLDYTFVKGVQIPLELIFRDIETSSSGISLLKLQIKANGKNTEAKLKNIPL